MNVNKKGVALDKQLASPVRTVDIEIDGSKVVIDQSLVVPYKNRAGLNMLKYIYWIVITQKELAEYKILSRQEYTRIVKALNNPATRFIKIDNDLISINAIQAIVNRVGYKDITNDKK